MRRPETCCSFWKSLNCVLLMTVGQQGDGLIGLHTGNVHIVSPMECCGWFRPPRELLFIQKQQSNSWVLVVQESLVVSLRQLNDVAQVLLEMFWSFSLCSIFLALISKSLHTSLFGVGFTVLWDFSLPRTKLVLFKFFFFITVQACLLPVLAWRLVFRMQRTFCWVFFVIAHLHRREHKNSARHCSCSVHESGGNDLSATVFDQLKSSNPILQEPRGAVYFLQEGPRSWHQNFRRQRDRDICCCSCAGDARWPTGATGRRPDPLGKSGFSTRRKWNMKEKQQHIVPIAKVGNIPCTISGEPNGHERQNKRRCGAHVTQSAGTCGNTGAIQTPWYVAAKKVCWSLLSPMFGRAASHVGVVHVLIVLLPPSPPKKRNRVALFRSKWNYFRKHLGSCRVWQVDAYRRHRRQLLREDALQLRAHGAWRDELQARRGLPRDGHAVRRSRRVVAGLQGRQEQQRHQEGHHPQQKQARATRALSAQLSVDEEISSPFHALGAEMVDCCFNFWRTNNLFLGLNSWRSRRIRPCQVTTVPNAPTEAAASSRRKPREEPSHSARITGMTLSLVSDGILYFGEKKNHSGDQSGKTWEWTSHTTDWPLLNNTCSFSHNRRTKT